MNRAYKHTSLSRVRADYARHCSEKLDIYLVDSSVFSIKSAIDPFHYECPSAVNLKHVVNGRNKGVEPQT